QDVASDLVHVEETGEQVVLELRTEGAGVIASQATGGRGAQVRHYRHERRTRPRMVVDHVMIFAIDAAVDGMNDAVAFSASRMLQERGREEALAARREDDVDGIVHAAGHHWLNPGAEIGRAHVW